MKFRGTRPKPRPNNTGARRARDGPFLSCVRAWNAENDSSPDTGSSGGATRVTANKSNATHQSIGNTTGAGTLNASNNVCARTSQIIFRRSFGCAIQIDTATAKPATR